MKLMLRLVVALSACMFVVPVAAQRTQSPRAELNESIARLQKTPDDAALREKIIKLAKKVKPAPVVPEEARRAFVRGNTAFSEAKGPEDYARAIQRYDEALLVAPWWRDPYFNLAKSLELQKEYGRAIQSIKLFLLTGPSADDARKAQDYTYALEDKQEKLTKEKSEQEAVSRAEEAKYGWILGEWKWVDSHRGRSREPRPFLAKKTGDGVDFFMTEHPDEHSQLRAKFESRNEISWEFWLDPAGGWVCPGLTGWVRASMTVSSDRRRLNFQYYPTTEGHCERGPGPYPFEVELTHN